MGPSGSGKSTLMHALAGLDRATSGSVTVDGVELADLDDAELTELRRDKIGFVFQFFNLLPVLTADENILLPLSLAGRDPDPELHDQLVEAVGLGDRLSHRPSELSGGQQQRVAVARALMSKPAVVFADEPTGNLDSKSSDEVLALLRRAVDDFGQTVVMVTHDAHAAATADRVVVLVDGRIVRDEGSATADAGPRPDEAGRRLTSIALRNLGARKLRTFLTALAIVLGVMMVAGTYVLTDTIEQSFDEIFTESNEGVDAVVTSKAAVETEDGQEPPIDASRARRRCAASDGVEAADGGITDPQVAIIDSDGERIGGGGAPTFAFSTTAERFDPLEYPEGGPPAADDEVVIDKAAAENAGFELGDQVTLAGKDEASAYELVGIATLGDVDSFGGASIALLTLPEAQRITGKQGKFDQITVAADRRRRPGDAGEEHRRRAARRASEVETGEENTQSQQDDVGEFISILKTALLVFAGVSLFVAAFLIFNTFSITVAQRTREFAMLRTLGANRRQIITSVVVEAFAIGVFASVLGLLAGHRLRPGDRPAVRRARDRPAQGGHRRREPHDHHLAGARAPAWPCWRP